MSTVLRPVGPHEPRVYWIRRAVLIGIVLILIIVVAEACSGGGGSGKGHGSAGNHPAPTITTTTPPTITTCDPTSLTLAVSTDTTTYTSGQAPKLIGVFTNPNTTACKLARSLSNEIWTIKSGTPTVWTTQGCPPSGNVPSSLTIAAGATKMVHIFWNGHVRGSDCQDAAVAAAGTYTLTADLDGVKSPAKHPAVFHITS